jgi:aspartyl protease family protein
MRGALTVLAIIAVLVLGMSVLFPDTLRGGGDTSAMLALLQAVMVAILVGSGLFASKGEAQVGIGERVKYTAIWIGIALFLVGAYSQREGFARLWANVTGEVNPAAAQTGNGMVTLRKANDGHFWAQVRVNGQTIRMMVDTGASGIALDRQDAQRAGIDVSALAFNIPTMTANGPSRAAGVRLQSIAVGDIVRDDVPATIMQAEAGVSLLGMGFLGELSEVRAQGDTLTLRE